MPVTTNINSIESALHILQMQDADMFEQASLMRDLCKQYHLTQSTLAKLLKVSQSNIGNKIRLLQYSMHERESIIKYQLSERHARSLLRILPPKRAKLIETVGILHLTVQQTEELVEKYSLDPSQDVNCGHVPPTSFDTPISVESFLQNTQNGAERLRRIGNKVSCLTETGESWHRITVTISK